MAERKHVYRLVVDKWPTENGEPFKDQELEYWQNIVEAFRAARTDELPPWLPTDFAEWLPIPAGMDYPQQPSSRQGYVVTYGEDPEYGPRYRYPGFHEYVLTVPAAPTRRFFTTAIPRRCLADLLAWGCDAHIERAVVSDWEVLPNG